MAKDTEKLIRQLSLISYLMAERRPVTATEIRRDVEGYSDMTEDAFARRFYADRAELDSLGIHLTVDRPADGFSEQENYSLAPEAFFLPAIAFTDAELAALQTALSLLDGEFAYAEPLRLALQQLTWGRPSPLGSPAQRAIGLGITGSAGGAELSARLAKVDTAIYRRKRIEFEYFTMQTRRDRACARSTRTSCCSRAASSTSSAGRTSAARSACSGSRASAARWPTRRRPSTTSSARTTSTRASTPTASRGSSATPRRDGRDLGLRPDRLARRAQLRPLRRARPTPTTAAGSSARRTRSRGSLLAWAIGYEQHARVLGPPELVEELHRRLERVAELHRGEPFTTRRRRAARRATREAEREPGGAPARARRDPPRALRPARHARLRADPGRPRGRAARVRGRVCEQLQISPQELREDVAVLNVVNFGGGAYVLYAEVLPNGEIEVDPEPYSDTFDRPARLLPIEARALLAAIELLGVHLSEHLLTARDKLEHALGDIAKEGLLVSNARTDDAIARQVGEAIEARRLIELEYYAENEDAFSTRVAEPYALINSREGWYVPRLRPGEGRRCARFRLDRIKRIEVLDADLRAAHRPRPDRRRRGLAADRPGRGLAHRPRLDLARARALGRGGAHRARRARRRRDHRRVGVQGRPLPRQGDPQGGRRRRRARAGRRPRGRARPPPSGFWHPPRGEPPRPDRDDGRRGRRVPRNGRGP